MSELSERLAGLSPAKKQFMEQLMRARREAAAEPIAVVGMACRFPGASDIPSFWRLIESGRDATGEIPSSRWNVAELYDPSGETPGRMTTRWGGFLEGVDQFDPLFFGVSPREAEKMDPQQRLLLEVTWEALEYACIPATSLGGSATGVFVGIGGVDYSRIPVQFENYLEHINAYTGTGNALSIAANRISYTLDLRGPSLSVDTACSSSLVAIHLAVASLRSGETSAALAGGVNLILTPETTLAFSNAHMLSPDGKCRPFDSSANGYVRGEGCGMVVLKRLADAVGNGDSILAVIRGSAVNQDGRTSGITAPNGISQQTVIRAALEQAGLSTREISYIEAHGTGTPLGDPIEVQTLLELFGSDKAPSSDCRIGSVKANIGHTETAAGIASLIKVALMMQHRLIPGQVHLEQLNPRFSLDGTRLKISKDAVTWEPSGVRYAGVSAFGFGGTNAHLVLEEPPAATPKPPAVERTRNVMALSARTDSALQQIAGSIAEHLEQHPTTALADACYSINTGRNAFSHRAAVIAESTGELCQRLAALAKGERAAGVKRSSAALPHRPQVAFLFAGQGSQYLGMARQLFETQSVFREVVIECDEILADELERPLLPVLYGTEADGQLLNETCYAQPALFVIEYALATLWKSWGIVPRILLGHSIGEYAAACFAGVFSLEEGLRLVAARGRLMQSLPRDGQMAILFVDREQVAEAIEAQTSELSIAAVNGPANTVISGRTTAIQEVVQQFQKRGTRTQLLNVSHAFHSPLMEPILDEFREVVGEIHFQPPSVPLAANLTGELVVERPLDAEYWIQHLRSTVQFAMGVHCVAGTHPDAVLEIGPSSTLLSMASRCWPEAKCAWVPSLRPQTDDWLAIEEAISELYVRGVSLNWQAFDRPWPRRRLALPTYPFERKACWYPASRRIGWGGARAGSQRVVHVLLGYRVPTALPQSVFETTLSASSPAYLADHQLHGSPVVPAAVYIEQALAAASQIFGPGRHAVENLSIQQPLLLPEGTSRQVQLTVSAESQGRCVIQIFSRLADDKESSWTLHATSLLCAETRAEKETDAPSLNLGDEQAAPAPAVARNEFYDHMAERGLRYGSTFQLLDQVRRGTATTQAVVDVPVAVRSQLDAYHLHPVLLDACLQSMAGLVPLEPNGSASPHAYVPTAVRRVTVYGRPTQSMKTCAVATRANEASSPEALEADVYLLDESGQAIASLTGVRIQRLGRSAVAASGRTLEDWLYQIQWESQPLSSMESGNGTPLRRPPQDWLVLADESGVGESLVEQLAARGDRCCVVRRGERFTITSNVTGYEINPCAELDYEQLLEAWTSSITRPAGIVHLWSLDLDPTQPLAGEAAMNCHSVLRLVRQLARAELKPPHLHLVTGGAQWLGDESCVAVMQAPLWGLGRTVANELPELRCQLIDLDPAHSVSHVNRLEVELVTDSGESQVVLRGNERFVPRLQRAPQLIDARGSSSRGCVPSSHQYRLLGRKHGFDSLEYASLDRKPPDPGEVEVQVRSAGLNFSDVLKAMGLYPGITDAVVPLGIECAGTVTAVGEGVECFRVGDDVLGVAPYSFASHARTAEYALVHKPHGLHDDQACTIPIAFLTAYYALVDLARLKPGERVLIHAAAGGVGLAALQIAQHLEAEVFATAGSDPKRDYLRSLGVQHVMNSRTLNFVDEIHEKTDRAGVDVVLNSLPGDAIPASLSVLSAYGRFLEIGKTDIYQNRMIGLLPFQDNLSYFAIDLDRMLRQRPEQIRALFAQVMKHFEDGAYRPLPITRFTARRAPEAFRYMAQRKNIGKVVIAFEDSEEQSERDGEFPATIRGDATYLVTGGLGALGLRLATWLQVRGAKHLALLARRAPTIEAADVIEQLRAAGCQVTVLDADVCQTASMRAAVDRITRELPPLRGVFHAAGVLADAILCDMTSEQLQAAMAPKVEGGWHLHQATQHIPLDFFVLFSSAASVFGSPGQGNYAAGNAFLDGLAQFRVRQGLPATAINWGPWAESGMAARGGTGRQLSARGMGLLPADRALAALDAILRSTPVNVAVMDARWDQLLGHASGRLPKLVEHLVDAPAQNAAHSDSDQPFRRQLRLADAQQRHTLLREFVASEVAAVMSIDRSELDVDQPLNALGLDSLMGIELKSEIEKRLRIELPMAALLDGPTVSSLAEHASKAVASASDDLSQRPGGETVAAVTQRHGISLALLASGGPGEPLFCVHPVGGDIRCYYQLAKAVADSRPVYAFRARGLDAASQPHRSVVELARDYVEAMREVQLSGPYHLCGWSTGGVFAYEMARQLEAAGVRIGALVFLDTPVPAIFQDVDLDDESRFLFDLVNFSNWFAGTQMEVDYQELKRLGAEQSLHYVLDQARKYQVLPADASVAYLQRLIRVCRDHVRAVRDYRLESISQTVEMIQPSDTSALAEASGQVLGEELGWRAVVGDRLTVYSVPGDHFSMLTGPYAPILARAVERCLADVTSARASSR